MDLLVIIFFKVREVIFTGKIASFYIIKSMVGEIQPSKKINLITFS
jgi:hypothetical protein